VSVAIAQHQRNFTGLVGYRATGASKSSGDALIMGTARRFRQMRADLDAADGDGWGRPGVAFRGRLAGGAEAQGA
jgi:hypothetical protein